MPRFKTPYLALMYPWLSPGIVQPRLARDGAARRRGTSPDFLPLPAPPGSCLAPPLRARPPKDHAPRDRHTSEARKPGLRPLLKQPQIASGRSLSIDRPRLQSPRFGHLGLRPRQAVFSDFCANPKPTKPQYPETVGLGVCPRNFHTL